MSVDRDEHTRLAVDAAGLGTWEMNPVTGERRWSRRCLELFGLEDDVDLSPASFERIIHPEDRERWRTALARALDPTSDAGGEYRVEYRTSGPEPRWIAATGRAFFEDGRAVRVIGTVQDVTARKAAEREREIFLAALGHDLRGPLTTIMIHSVLLQRRSDGIAAEPIARITASTKRMARLIDDLIEFSRCRTGDLQLERAKVDLADVCREILYEVALPHPERKIELTLTGDTHGEWDADRIGQVVQNLATNAVVHGDPSSTVEVSVAGTRDGVRISVKNHGEPIAAELREHLFDPFRRGGKSHGSPKGTGLGLGLYIVKEIVAAHGGQVAYESDAEGTVFRVELPRTV